ncbi:MAG: XdhC family protein, partial [Acidobacteriota bacterium]|nr:XdhC family protein [Acidobacteriota bacterium]
MNELQAIVDAHADARARGERAALATVVAVSGSAYRRPGARMLITEGGRTVGAISGGCLERDVAERAAPVISSG